MFDILHQTTDRTREQHDNGPAIERAGQVTGYLRSLVPARQLPKRTRTPTPTNTVYINPTGAAGTGTLADPRNTFPTPLVSNTAYLLREGTTATMTVNAALSCVNLNTVVIGVYSTASPFTGHRLRTAVGAATIDGAGFATLIDAYQGDDICLEGIKVTGFTGNVFTAYNDTLTSQRLYAVNCVRSGGSRLVDWAVNLATGTGGSSRFIIEGNHVVGCTSGSAFAVYATQANMNIPGLRVAFNTITGGVTGSAVVLAGAGDGTTTLPGGIIAANRLNGNGTHGLWLNIIDPTGLLIYGNSCNQNTVHGIDIVGPRHEVGDFFVEHNVCCNNEMGIWLGSILGGSWTVQGNVTWFNGSKSNTAPAASRPGTNYGRGIELYSASGGDQAYRVEGGTVRFNSCCFSYDFGGTTVNGTEGVGIGLDDETSGVAVYGNYIAYNEGNGLQNNGQDGNVITGNLFISNGRRPTIPRGGNPPDFLTADISYTGYCANTVIVNNTFYCDRASTWQRAGVHSADGAIPGVRVQNNLFINYPYTAIATSSDLTGATYSNNAFVACVANYRKGFAGLAVVPNSAGDQVLASLPSGMVAPFYVPPVLHAIATGGTDTDATAISFTGRPFDAPMSIGAVPVWNFVQPAAAM